MKPIGRRDFFAWLTVGVGLPEPLAAALVAVPEPVAPVAAPPAPPVISESGIGWIEVYKFCYRALNSDTELQFEYEILLEKGKSKPILRAKLKGQHEEVVIPFLKNFSPSSTQWYDPHFGPMLANLSFELTLQDGKHSLTIELIASGAAKTEVFGSNNVLSSLKGWAPVYIQSVYYSSTV